MITRREFQHTGVLALAALAGNTAGAGVAVRPNVLFIMTDQWRYYAQGYAGCDPVQTPHLDGLARQSQTFHNAIACSPVCGPNRACWMTGLYPQHHGVLKNEAAHVNPDQLLSRCFRQAGYATGYIGKWHLSGEEYPRRIPTPDFLKQDFETWYRTENHTHFQLKYDDNGTMRDFGKGWQPGHEVDKSIEFMQNRNSRRPFFLTLSMGPPHNGSYPGFGEKRHTPGAYSHRKGGYGYYAPVEFEKPYLNLTEQEIRKNIRSVKINYGKTKPADLESDYESALGAVPGYFGACSAMDADIGRLLDYLKTSGLDKNTIVVFSSDHGEMLGSQGLMTKGVCFEESIRVPLMLHIPGLKGAEHSRLFNSTDVMPTLLGLCGVEVPGSVDGINHAAFLRGDGKADAEPEVAYIGYAGWRGWRTKRYTYVTSTTEFFGGREAYYLRAFHQKRSGHMLFDLKNDPYQQRPVFKGDTPATDALIEDFHHQLYAELKARGETIPESV